MVTFSKDPLQDSDRMMRASRGVIIACLLTLTALNCESAFQEIDSIEDLKRVYFDKSLPLHSITLLHWFANSVDIENKRVVCLPFDPNGDFGSHYYDNSKHLLPPSSPGYNYYTIGNVDQSPMDRCPYYRRLPDYVLYPLRVIELADIRRNMDRMIVQTYNFDRVRQMYLTQHYYNQGSGYDHDHTFRISINLLQELRLFSFSDNPHSLEELRDQFNLTMPDWELDDLINIWGMPQARLGLLFLIVLPERTNQVGVCRSNDVEMTSDLAENLTASSYLADYWKNCEKLHIHFEVITGGNGKAEILWRNVPVEQSNDVAVALFRNQVDEGTSLTFKKIESSEGSYDTSVPLNEGLQVRLHKVEGNGSPSLKEEICRGKEFQSPQAVSVTGYAQLQLFVRNSKACFRLYIKKDCDQWKSDFYYSWVALYKSAAKNTKDYLYNQWQWATKFKQGPNSGENDTFEYCTETTLTPGLQARFMINKKYEEKARTPVWR